MARVDAYEVKIVLRLSLAFLVAFVSYLAASFFIVRSLSLNKIRSYLEKTASSVVQDFDYRNDEWYTNRYLSDEATPTENPLYIFSLDGFLIDRMNVIQGLLDTSHFTYASSFAAPKTITSPIGETWRVFSYGIERDGQKKGIILVAYFEPMGRPVQELDALLLAAGKTLDRQIVFSGGRMDTTKIIDKELEHNISFEIVDTFNVSHKSVGGPPAYIDKSYIHDVLIRKDFWVKEDARSGKKYLLHARPIVADGNAVGLVVIGRGLDQLDEMLASLLKLSLAAGAISVLLFTAFAAFIYRRDIRKIIEERLTTLTAPRHISVERIAFDHKSNAILVNGVQCIEIPPDSYQYDICRALFKNPRKSCDVFDLSSAIGERDGEEHAKRRIYDAVEAVNERVMQLVGTKLIVYKDKKYFINPSLPVTRR